MIQSILNFVNNFAANTFWFLVVVGILVFLHESGHFLTAKAFGMHVDVFSLGFGKRLWGWRRRETDYRLSLIPLGGYVKLTGGEEAGEESAPTHPDYFLARPRWQRFLVLVMGVAVNIILAVALFAAAFVLGVEVTASHEPVIKVVRPDSPASAIDLRPGDRILTAEGAAVHGWIDLEKALVRGGKNGVRLQVGRAGEKLEKTVVPEFGDGGIPEIGARAEEPAVVSQVEPSKPAARAGIQPNDQILAIEGLNVADFTEVSEVISRRVGRETSLTIRRGTELLTIQVTPAAVKLPSGEEVGRIGVGLRGAGEFVKLPVREAVVRAVETAVENTTLVFAVLKNLVTRNLPFSTLSGPIEIAKGSRASAAQGSQFLMWLALISLQLGIMNLLPIPGLDGGHIFILLTEGVLRRDLSFTIKERVQQVGILFLVGLMAAVLLQDIWRNV